MSYPNSEKGGLIDKYIIQKADGSSIDPDAQYFVLRIDGGKDPAAIAALKAYINEIHLDNPQLANYLAQKIGDLQEVNREDVDCKGMLQNMLIIKRNQGAMIQNEVRNIFGVLEGNPNCVVKRYEKYRFIIYGDNGNILGQINF